MAELLGPELDSILEGTSRSFYLSLKQLPSKTRSQIGLLYLLARTSDTIADSEAGLPERRIQALKEYNEKAQGWSEVSPDLSDLASMQSNESEMMLLRKVTETVACIANFNESDQKHIRNCLDIIVSGQALDLERFSKASETNIIPLRDKGELDDYAYRVAGSVGEFWTRMSIDHLFKADDETADFLFHRSVRFGKALQLINILRDIPEDLRLGRCYVPRESLEASGLAVSDLLDPSNMEKFRPIYEDYIEIASQHLAAAVEYIGMLPHGQYRLRGACMLPVLLGKQTLTMLRISNVLDSKNRIKVSRREVKEMRNKILLALPFNERSKKLLEAQ